MSELTLFDMGPDPSAEPEENLSADRRRTLRQKQALDNGRHPIGICFGFTLRLHDDAAPAAERQAEGLRCGACRFRHLQSGEHNGSFPKCQRGDGQFATNGASSDCRAWWPACTFFEPRSAKDNS